MKFRFSDEQIKLMDHLKEIAAKNGYKFSANFKNYVESSPDFVKSFFESDGCMEHVAMDIYDMLDGDVDSNLICSDEHMIFAFHPIEERTCGTISCEFVENCVSFNYNRLYTTEEVDDYLYNNCDVWDRDIDNTAYIEHGYYCVYTIGMDHFNKSKVKNVETALQSFYDYIVERFGE